jgi:hypothetical protein
MSSNLSYAEVSAAYKLLSNTRKVGEMLGEVNTNTEHVGNSPALPANPEDNAALFLLIANGVGEEDATFAELLERTVQIEDSTTRSTPEILDLLNEVYSFAKDHWGEVAFLIEVLDRRKVFDRLKKKSKNLKAIIETVLEEDEETSEEEDQEKNDD